MERPSPRTPTLLEALTPLVVMAVLLAVGYSLLGYRVEVCLIASVAGHGAGHGGGHR